MKILLKNAQVIDPAGAYHGKSLDLFVDNGRVSLKVTPAAADLVVDTPGLHVSPGWVDLHAHSGEPGNESAETLDTLCAAAACGGFAEVLVMPDTDPAIDHKDGIYSLLQRSRHHATKLLAAGAITRGLEGKKLAEMQDMHHAGAVAFTDVQPTTSADILLKALLYVQPFNGLIINQPQDADLSRFGQMHEGIQSTLLGLKGIPALAEELMIERDLRLLEYTGGRLHFSGISSARGVQLIREAKKRGQRITCDVTFHHLIFNDNDLEDFNTQLKLSPPLRTEGDRQALLAAVLDDTVDAIVSGHYPLTPEHKELEFDQATPGATGLEVAFAALTTRVPELPLTKLVHKLTIGPRMVLGLPAAHIEEGSSSSLTLFHPSQPWVYGPGRQSRSVNSPFLNQPLTGRSLGIINGERHLLTQAAATA